MVLCKNDENRSVFVQSIPFNAGFDCVSKWKTGLSVYTCIGQVEATKAHVSTAEEIKQCGDKDYRFSKTGFCVKIGSDFDREPWTSSAPLLTSSVGHAASEVRLPKAARAELTKDIEKMLSSDQKKIDATFAYMKKHNLSPNEVCTTKRRKGHEDYCERGGL
jgi:hypothetical protein